MADPAKNILIGLFVIAACFLIVGVLLFLHPTVGDCGKIMMVRFSDIDKINTGTRVTFAGKPIGEVLQIQQLDVAREGETDNTGKVYLYELTLCIDSGVTVYTSDEITAFTSGLLGERSISIIPRKPKPGEESLPVTNQVLHAKSSGSVDDAVQMMGQLAEKAEVALDVFNNVLTENQEQLKAMIGNMSDTFAEAKKVMVDANTDNLIESIRNAADQFGLAMESASQQFSDIEKQQLWATLGRAASNVADITDGLNDPTRWKEILSNIHSLSESFGSLEFRLSNTWDKLDKTVDVLDEAMQNMNRITTDTKAIVTDIREGRGSLGQIVSGDDLYLRLMSVMSKADTLMNDVNHYGILFHREKGWQRERTKRMRQVQEIACAAEFTRYYQREVDQMSTSLARVAVLMEQAEDCHLEGSLAENRLFNSAMRDLLSSVRELHNRLELYNQEISEAAE